jgi:holo-[acyl-carrier protein] synthase
MIIGIGTDMVDITRMTANIAEHGDRLAQKILGDAELADYEATSAKAQFLASRFAAKEAVAKALGTGFRDGLSLKHIEVQSDPLGRPHIRVSERAQELMNSLKVTSAHLTLTHERDLALAFVVLCG